VISSLPPELRCIKNLFIHNPLPYIYKSDIYDSDEDSDANNDRSQSTDPTLPKEGLAGKASASKELGEAQKDTDKESDSDVEQSHLSHSEDSFEGVTAKEQAELVEEIKQMYSKKTESSPDWLENFFSNSEDCQYAILYAFHLILQKVALTLKSLMIHFIMYQHYPLEVIIPELPVLQDLSLYRMCPYHSNHLDCCGWVFPLFFHC